MMYKSKFAVCSDIRTKHSAQSEDHVEFLNVNLLKPNTCFMYRQFNINKFCVLPTVHLCVLCGSQNKQRLFLYTALTYRLLKPKQTVFTARYEKGL